MSGRVLLLLIVCALTGCERHAPQRPDEFPILTPPVAATPRINGARVFGVRPGSPFLFQVAVSGERPMQLSARNLPPDLSLDQESGLITGRLNEAARHVVTLRAQNARGVAERELTIICGAEIALTPPMGWNSWNRYGGNATQADILAAARQLVSSGLRDHGWTYVNVDDGWQGIRGGPFQAIQPNRKFPDMARLSAEIHSLGLKFGIYSTPWRTSFNGQIGSSADTAEGKYEWLERGEHDANYKFRFPRSSSPPSTFERLLARWREKRQRDALKRSLRTFGRYSFVAQDVQQWREWQVDSLKYDWVPVDAAHAAAMQQELQRPGRDIFLSVANNTPFAAAPEISRLTNSWRTSGDVKDRWRDVQLGFAQDRWAPFQRPGHYNDADMLVLGEVGWGYPWRTRLTSDEQYSHMSLWCLLGGPLLFGGNLQKLDPFTLGLLTNDEVLEVNQDSLGKQATRVARDGKAEIYAKPLDDGSWAVGLFNRASTGREVTLEWTSLNLHGEQLVRDLWRQKDLGVYRDRFRAAVAGHGVLLLRVQPPR